MNEVFGINWRRAERVGTNPFGRTFASHDEAKRAGQEYLGSFAGCQEVVIFKLRQEDGSTVAAVPVESLLREDLAALQGIRKKHDLSFRYVGSAPTFEATGLASDELKAALGDAGFPYRLFVANNRDHRDYNRECLEFSVFGEVDREPLLAYIDVDGRRIDLSPDARWYVGVGIEGRVRECFQSAVEPTVESHGDKYAAVIGPFETERGARFMADYGAGNPHCQTVEDAEQLAALEEKTSSHGDLAPRSKFRM